MAHTVKKLLVENNLAYLANTKDYFEREAPHIRLHVADSIAAARENLKAQPFDALVVTYSAANPTTLDLLSYIQQNEIPVATVVLADDGNYRALRDAIRHGADRAVI